MALPKYNDLYDIFLNYLADGQPRSCGDMRRHIVQMLQIPDEDLRQLLPHGNGKTVFMGRVSWAGTYLRKAGLIDYPKRGVYQITKEGKKLLAQGLPTIDNNTLCRYPSFVAFLRRSSGQTDPAPKGKTPEPEITISNSTPEDTIAAAINEMNVSLEDDLLSAIMEQDADFFENLVVSLMQKMGYGKKLESPGLVTGQSGDEGIDGIIREDKLGFNSIYIQAKRWKRDLTVGRPEIQKFVGALAGQGAQKGLFITTAKFSKAAQEYAEKHLSYKVVLVDGPQLAELMIEHNLGVSVKDTYQVKQLDSDFFPDLSAEH